MGLPGNDPEKWGISTFYDCGWISSCACTLRPTPGLNSSIDREFERKLFSAHDRYHDMRWRGLLQGCNRLPRANAD
jgi:hypothetical protein